MSVMVTVEIPVQAGKMASLLEMMTQALPATRAFDGCLKVETFAEDGEQSLILVEMWETLGHQKAYMKWRMETGLVDALAPFGVRHADMPLTPSNVWRAIQGNPISVDMAIE